MKNYFRLYKKAFSQESIDKNISGGIKGQVILLVLSIVSVLIIASAVVVVFHISLGRNDDWGEQLLRENENGVRRIVHLNLLDASITQSPYFYLQQNDVIYVKPKKAKVNTNTFNTNTSMWITMISVLTSVSTLIIALTK